MTFSQVRAWLIQADRLTLILVLCVLLSAFIGWSLYRGTPDFPGLPQRQGTPDLPGLPQRQGLTELREELAAMKSRLKVVNDDLAYLEANDETASLQATLNEELAKPKPQALPSQAAVGEFSNTLFEYAASQGLSFTTFDKIDTSVSIGDTAYSSLRHSLEAQGTGQAQTGLLQLISEFQTAKVLDLVFTRSGDPTEWYMRLELDVYYR